MRIHRSIVGVSLAVVAMAWMSGSNVATSAPPDAPTEVFELLIGKTYDLQDLPVWRNGHGKTFDPKPLLDLMMFHIDQDSWKRMGISASFPKDRTLEIVQTEKNHVKIEKFLQAIRDSGSDTGRAVDLGGSRPETEISVTLDPPTPSEKISTPSSGLQANGSLVRLPPKVTEYLVRDIKGLDAASVQDTLNQSGDDRWELVDVREEMLIFKRPKFYTTEEVEAHSKARPAQ